MSWTLSWGPDATGTRSTGVCHLSALASAVARARINCPDRNRGRRDRRRSSMPEVAVGNLFVIQKFYNWEFSVDARETNCEIVVEYEYQFWCFDLLEDTQAISLCMCECVRMRATAVPNCVQPFEECSLVLGAEKCIIKNVTDFYSLL